MKERILDNLEHITIFVAILLATITVAFFVNRFFRKQIKKSTEILHTNPTNYQFLHHLVIVLIYTIGISIAIHAMPELRPLATSLLAGAGVLALAVGFASQQVLSNIISGIFLLYLNQLELTIE